jgi:hypothetical protein
MVVGLTQSLPLQAVAAVLLRDKNHHPDENQEPRSAVFLSPEVDRFDVGTAVDYRAPYQTENAVRGVAKDNPRGRRFHAAATELWGELSPYTGY